ncbi:MAG TPA: threonine synthase [Vicinamibacterales bacterium]|jgi:threonine synthase
MRFVTTKNLHLTPAVSFSFALFEGIAPDGGLYVPESMPKWSPEELARLPSMTLAAIGARVLQPFVDELDSDALLAVLEEALAFPIPLVEVEPGIYALELFHGPTLAFKDVGARVMARLMAALFRGDNPLTILVATSGDTGSAVAHAFHDVPHTRVAILYPKGRVSPTQEAQLTMFNGEATNVRAYAAGGSFDDCQRLTKAAFADPVLSRRANLTSANSINIGRLLPQMIYYAHAVGQLTAKSTGVAQDFSPAVFSTPSGNFGNITAGLMAKRSGIDIRQFVAATNVNDVVPEYLVTGTFTPRPSIHTLANAMDVGNPSNFDRLMWLYGSDLDAIRRDVVGSRHDDVEVRATIQQVYEERGYLLDPHSAIAYLGLTGQKGREGQGVFLATAHPAKFAEVVEPIIGRAIPKPQPLVEALATKRKILEIDATLGAVEKVLA